MNETITAALREHAEGDIHIDRLLGAVHAGAHRRQRRRRAVAGGALIVIAVAALVGVRGLLPGRSPVAEAPPAATPRPPRVDGAVPASASTTELGVDPTLFHLDLDGLDAPVIALTAGGPDRWTSLSWAAQPGHETLAGQLESGQAVRVEADRERDGLTWRDGPRWPVTIAGQPAEAIAVADGSYAVQWQPVPGIWAQVDVATPDNGDVHTAIGIAERVRLDRVYRCAAAFRVVGVPPAQLNKCATDYWRGEAGWQAGSEAWFTIGGAGPEFLVAVGDAVPVVVNATIAGRTVEVVHPTDGPATLAIRYPYAGRTAYFWAFGPADDEVVNALVAGFSPRPDGNPDHWPSSPFE